MEIFISRIRFKCHQNFFWSWLHQLQQQNSVPSKPTGQCYGWRWPSIEVFVSTSDWFHQWNNRTSNCCPSKQKARTLISTIHSQVMLLEDLFAEWFEFILASRLKSDPIERRFSQYHSMSRGWFLVSMREVFASEKSQIKTQYYWTKNLNTQKRGTLWMVLFESWSWMNEKLLSIHHCTIAVKTWHIKQQEELQSHFKWKINANHALFWWPLKMNTLYPERGSTLRLSHVVG